MQSFDRMDAFLNSDRAPEACMRLSEQDGFRTGPTLPRTSMSPPNLLSIWGSVEPAYADEDEAKFVMNTILDRLDEITKALQHAPADLNPIM